LGEMIDLVEAVSRYIRRENPTFGPDNCRSGRHIIINKGVGPYNNIITNDHGPQNNCPRSDINTVSYFDVPGSQRYIVKYDGIITYCCVLLHYDAKSTMGEI